MGPHGGGVEGEAAEEPGRVERAPVASWEGMRRSAHTVEGSKVKRRRSLGELKGRLLQAGKA